MKPIHPMWLTMLLVVAGGAEARAQFFRGTSNPYGQNASGFSTGAAANPYNQFATGNASTGFPFTSGSLFGPPSRSSTYEAGSNFNVFAPNLSGGYMSGGGGSYSNYSTIFPSMGSVSGDGPRKAFDRWAIERERELNGPNGPKKQAELRQYLTRPSALDLSSGAALNAILEALAPLADKVKSLPPTAIDETFLKRLNFTRGTGSIGLLRQEGQIPWPKLLLKVDAEDEVAARKNIEKRFLEAFNQVAGGAAAEADNLKALHEAIGLFGRLVSARSQSLTFAETVEAKRFLTSLEDSVLFLKQSDAAEWLPGKSKAVSKSLQELVLRMLDKKVRFAPAVVGNDGAYTTMHRAMAALFSQAAAPQVSANR
jgi:hypothetical protein